MRDLMAIQNRKSSDAVAIVACMDWRLNFEIDNKITELRKEYGDNVTTYLFRNAGAGVKAFEGSIKDIARDYNLKALVIMPHNEGCRGMGLVFDALKNEVPVSSDMRSQLVEPFHSHTFSDTGELEKINPKVQADYARGFLGNNVNIISELVDLKRVKMPEDGEHRIFIMKPCAIKYELSLDDKRGGAYVLQASNLSEVFPDLNVGVNVLKMRKIIFVTNSQEEARLVNTEIRIARMKLGNDVELSQVSTY